MTDLSPSASEQQRARFDLQAGPLSVKVRIRVTPTGLLAIGGLVSSILLSTAVLVWSATSVPRRHPLASRLGR